VWVDTTAITNETTTQIDHEEGEVHGIRDGCLRDHHEILQAPVWLGIAERKLDVEPQLVIIAQFIPGQRAVTAEEIDMRLLAGGLVVRDDHHDIHGLITRLVARLDLIDAGLDVVFHRRLLQVSFRDRGRVDALAIDSVWATSRVRAIIGVIQHRVAPPLGDELHAKAAGHQHGILVAEMPIQHQIGQGEVRADASQERLDHRTDAGVFRIQGRIGLGLRAAALRASWFPLQRGHRRGQRWGRFAHHLLNLHGECRPFRATDQGQREQRDPRHRFANDTGEEAIHAIRLRARFGHHTFITDQQMPIPWRELRADEDPKECRPRQRGMKEARHRALAATASRPARKSQHRHSSRHREHGQRNSAQLPQGRSCDRTGQAAEEW